LNRIPDENLNRMTVVPAVSRMVEFLGLRSSGRRRRTRLKRSFNKALALLILIAAGAAPALCATSYTLITEPNQGLTAIYNLINSAQHTIDMTMYELSDTTAEQDLVNRAAAGVTVRVILDINLEESNNQAAYTYLNDNGVQCHWADTKYAATHQKTITIDSAYATAQTAILTLNLTPQYYSTSRDFGLIENDLNDIAAIETTFNADFNSTAITPPTGDDLVWSPTNSQTAMVSALASAAKRGVNVQIVMNAGTYTSEWKTITTAGGFVSTYPATETGLYIHAKIMVADYGYSTGSFFLGSENFSSASLTENRELGVIINNLPVMQSLVGTLTSDFDGGTPQTGSPADFTLLPSSYSATAAAGSSTTATVTATPFNSFKTAVALSAFDLPSGVTASFSPSSISGASGSSTVTFTVSSSVAAGSYLIGILGTAGSTKNTTAINLTVTGGSGGGSFSLSASPASVSVTQGSTGTSTITSTVSGGFDSTVSLSASGLPTGVTAAFSPSSLTGGSGSSTLTFTASSTATTGTSTITITGTGGGTTETTTVSLTVKSGSTPSFSLSASPSSVSVTQGATGTSTITSTVSGGFDSTVSLAASGLPSGVTAAFSPASISGGAGSSTLTFTASGTATTGTSTVTITGTGGGVTATTSVALTVNSSGGGGQLIKDGSFQSATKSGVSDLPYWTGATTSSGHDLVIVDGARGPTSGSNYGLLGGVDNTNDTLTQTITIPAGSTSTPLTFLLSIYTTETNSNGKAYDYLYVEIHNTKGTLLKTVLTFTNLNGSHDQQTSYISEGVDLSAYAGETVELVFHGTNDKEDATTFYVDDISVTAN
jgi:cardiolipin synthase